MTDKIVEESLKSMGIEDIEEVIRIVDGHWRPIPGYGGKYEMSVDGRIRNVRRGIIKEKKNGSVSLERASVIVKRIHESVWSDWYEEEEAAKREEERVRREQDEEEMYKIGYDTEIAAADYFS